MHNVIRISFILVLLALSFSNGVAQQPTPTPSPTATPQPQVTPTPPPSNPSNTTSNIRTTRSVEDTPISFWICAGAISLLLLLILFAIMVGLRSSPTWSLGDAVSEEAGNQPNPLPAGQKPILVASSSRLIALLGLMVILVIYLGFGYCALWRCFMSQQMLEIRGLLSFLFGGASMFAPYMVNQLKEAFSSFAPTATNTSTGGSGSGGAPVGGGAAPGGGAAAGPGGAGAAKAG